MNKNIYKGMHYCLNFLNFKPYCFKQAHSLSYEVVFTDSCKYDIGSDQSDINKLFGFSYGFHHHQSDRIGWRWNPSLNKIELLLYSYEQKVRRSFKLTEVALNTLNIIELEVYLNGLYRHISIKINNETYAFCLLQDPVYWGYTLGLYFGGNRTAPHNMNILINSTI
jgi:hypothetical protein